MEIKNLETIEVYEKKEVKFLTKFFITDNYFISRGLKTPKKVSLYKKGL